MKYNFLLYLIIIILSCRNKQQHIENNKFEYILADNNATINDLQFIIDNKVVTDSIRIEAYNKLFFKTVYSDSVIAKKIYQTLFQFGVNNQYANARAYNLKGIYLDVKGEYDSALINYKRAIQISIQTFPNIEGAAYNNIGLIYWNRGDYYEAINNYNKAITLFEMADNKLLQANAQSNIGLIYLDINNADKSNYYFQKSLNLRRQINDEYGISVSYTNLARLYIQHKNYNDAIVILDSAAKLKIKLNDEIGLSNTLYNQADCYYKIGDYEKALTLLKNAEELCIKNGSESNNLTNIYIGLGEVYVKTAQIQKLQELLDKFKKQIEIRKDERNFQQYYTLLSDYYILKRDNKNALLFYKKADSIYNKIEGIEVKKAINLYETQYQTEKKEKELATAQLKISNEKLRSKQKNNWLIFLGGSIIIGLAFFKNYRSKSRFKQKQLSLENQLLQEQSLTKMQEQRLAISRDLHDSLGAQLTFMNTILDSLKINSEFNDKTAKKIEYLSEFAENSVAELKSVLWVLNNEDISLHDLKAKLLNFIKNAGEANDDITFNIDFEIKDAYEISGKQAISIFRVTQEIVNNALKHAYATEIKLNIIQHNNLLEINISDNGIGFNLLQEENKSYGINNIKERIKAIEGTLIIDTKINKGAHFNIQIPLYL
jgi:signal transduction histidine kinase